MKTLRIGHAAMAVALLAAGLTSFTVDGQAQVVADDVVCSGCVDNSDIADSTILPGKIVPGSINATTIANKSISANKLVPGSINSTVIADGSIGANKLVPGSINSTVIADGSIGPNKLIPGSINNTVIANNTITGNKLADAAIGSPKIANGAVTAPKLGADAVNTNKILNGTILLVDLDQEVIDAINAGGGGGGGPMPVTHDVDCVGPSGDFASVQAAVNAANDYDTILMVSDCTEDVTVSEVDGLTFTSDANGDMNQGGDFTLTGTLFIDSVDADVQYITVSGGSGPGIWFQGGAQGTITGAISTGHTESGIRLSEATDVGIEDSQSNANGDGSCTMFAPGLEVGNASNTVVDNSTFSNNCRDGVVVYNASFANISNSTISGNGGPFSNFDAGIQVFADGSVRTFNTTIQDNTYAGVEVGQRSFYRSSGDTISALDDGGCDFLNNFDCPLALETYRQGYIEIRDGTVVDGGTQSAAGSNFQQSLFEWRASTITGDVQVGQLSYARARSNATFNGVFNCEGTTVSDASMVSGTSICRDDSP